MKKNFIIIMGLLIGACSSDNADEKESKVKVLDRQMKALEKAKNVEDVLKKSAIKHQKAIENQR